MALTTEQYAEMLKNFTEGTFNYLEEEDYPRFQKLWLYFKQRLVEEFGDVIADRKAIEVQEHIGYQAGYRDHVLQLRTWNQMGAYHPFLGPPVGRPHKYSADMVLQLGVLMGMMSLQKVDYKSTVLYYPNRTSEQQLIDAIDQYKLYGKFPEHVVFEAIDANKDFDDSKLVQEKLDTFKNTLKIK